MLTTIEKYVVIERAKHDYECGRFMGMCTAIANALSIKFQKTILYTEIYAYIPELLKHRPTGKGTSHYWWQLNLRAKRTEVFQKILDEYFKILHPNSVRLNQNILK